jgi:hypothetical protein
MEKVTPNTSSYREEREKKSQKKLENLTTKKIS